MLESNDCRSNDEQCVIVYQTPGDKDRAGPQPEVINQWQDVPGSGSQGPASQVSLYSICTISKIYVRNQACSSGQLWSAYAAVFYSKNFDIGQHLLSF